MTHRRLACTVGRRVLTDFHGASVEAMRRLGRRHGYTMVYCESAGVNCFLVRDDVLGLPAMPRGEREEVLASLTTPRLHRPPRYFGYEGWEHPRDERERAFLAVEPV